MKKFIRTYGLLLVTLIVLLVLICWALLLIPESQIPTMLQSSGLVSIISAFLGVFMTVAVTAILLEKQADSESKKEKDIKIFTQKIEVYSEFLSAMWGMLDKKEEEYAAAVKQLRANCFQKLILHLDEGQIEEISKKINDVNPKNYKESEDSTQIAMGEITRILQDNLRDKENPNESDKKHSGFLLALYKSFIDQEAEQQNEQGPVNDQLQNEQEEKMPVNDQAAITYWHFCMLGPEQEEIFTKGNWRLVLIEYNERWRTDLSEQIKPGDVIFLFRRGGSGYIGAFRAKAKGKRYEKPDGKSWDDILGSNRDDIDIYDSTSDGATLVANVEVEPIAYNYKGVGYWSVRRRTIERMNDTNAVKFILKRFKGELDKDWDEERLSGKDKLDENTEIKEIIERDYFNKIIKQFNI
jgi:hypothetical protein